METPVLSRGSAVPKGLVGVTPTPFNTLVLKGVEWRAPLSDIVIRWKRRENTSGGRPCFSQALPFSVTTTKISAFGENEHRFSGLLAHSPVRKWADLPSYYQVVQYFYS